MHMADALISPAVGGTLWVAAGGTIAYCARKVRQDLDERKVPLMGVLGAFVFAAQMINFTIPGTGSSGHLGGGLLLAVLLGPHAAFLTIASVLVVQALFFADGGLLALGCNIVNLGFFPAFVAYPLIYRAIAPAGSGQGRSTAAAVAAAVVGLQFGALSVVLETVASGISALPFSSFVLLMQPIHLAIGIVEGLVTAAVVGFVVKAHPEVIGATRRSVTSGSGFRWVAVSLLALAVITGGVVSRYASGKPDGLEWAIAGVTGKGELASPTGGVHGALAAIQKKSSSLPAYSFAKPTEDGAGEPAARKRGAAKGDDRLGTSVSGIAGGGLTLVMAFAVGFLLRRRAAS
ncbi:cobalamin (vitamin B12) biosynthesis CbiM protein [Geobacter metallireducens RCH3]|uniref:Nickel ABC transporter, membrane protein NikMN n=1 Tax=Geobacter metallireducens (strain ATCC 53774 / DSM 7210 / GS-15) TaxID=269799 RepID=Q39SV8_GEOMG|nr:energy-coupling factor ABC transporter permease [Geobacter metallireducens]ABB32666.1 nickel ABC transporter, membrane protein NikMN [Geobacter metallireducens GS-15]EHP87841.1 cobalamin (vitamin B12) biosynthesis CbiM protein [Geobacter metallireducens RCH3]